MDDGFQRMWTGQLFGHCKQNVSEDIHLCRVFLYVKFCQVRVCQSISLSWINVTLSGQLNLNSVNTKCHSWYKWWNGYFGSANRLMGSSFWSFWNITAWPAWPDQGYWEFMRFKIYKDSLQCKLVDLDRSVVAILLFFKSQCWFCLFGKSHGFSKEKLGRLGRAIRQVTLIRQHYWRERPIIIHSLPLSSPVVVQLWLLLSVHISCNS